MSQTNTTIKVTTKDVSLTSAQTKTLEKCPSKSAKIRFLTSLEWTRSQIATHLDIRYQHVRNVQITPLTSKK